MKMRCPNCGKIIDPATRKRSKIEKFYPFCSERCKWVDLGHWLDEDYRIATDVKKEDAEQKTDDKA